MFNRYLNLGLRWSARLISLFFSLFFLLFFVGEGIPGIIKNPASELIPFLPWLGLALAGAALAWKFERLGAALMILGAIAMGLYKRDMHMVLIYSLPYFLSGILLLLRSSRTSRKNMPYQEPLK